MDIKEKFGQRLRVLRKEKGLSQEELAEKSGLNRPYISAIELGKRNVSLEVMEKLAGALVPSLNRDALVRKAGGGRGRGGGVLGVEIKLLLF
ncbi:helix-turn-helix transcriptional regulator [Algoriphagus sp. NF]|uniref:helix-turn-helix domain-containing protein n=1 Tax=Algoriphagus sp. NF TaxID=2992756 RepID=UPI00237AC00F|nr:helix-turn-helix transcriptional regulator [Algoriphagus sp. NF]MDE0561992.1 helix-turn-helix transcriptional regulator [Algoriphagus sp. NF]